jgi:hypothetical protein
MAGVIATVVMVVGCSVSPSATSSVETNESSTSSRSAPDEPSSVVPQSDEGALQEDMGGETPSQENARRAAENYLDVMAFSRSGLIDQLKYEGFSKADAEYAVDVLRVDWKEQAAKKAQEYLDSMPFSRAGLIDQLEYEGFSSAEAEYGVSRTGL